MKVSPRQITKEMGGRRKRERVAYTEDYRKVLEFQV